MPLLTTNWCYDFITLFIILMVSAIIWMKKQYTYWEKRDVLTPKPTFLIGNLGDVFLQRVQFAEWIAGYYRQFKSENLPYGGVYFFAKPEFVPVDPDVIKLILQTDFQYFTDRGAYYNEESDPLSAHLAALDGVKWKNLRAKLTPAFTSGKMKMMFETLVETSKELVVEMDKKVQCGAVDIKDILARFTIDVISSCAFGIESNSLHNPDSEFKLKSENLFVNNFRETIVAIFISLWPKKMKRLGFKITKQDFAKFFLGIIKATVDYREKTNLYRKDFMHLLLQLKNRGILADDESVLRTESDKNNFPALTFNEIAAQSFVFFVGGFETSSTLMTFCLYELCVYQDVQSKLRDEVIAVQKKYDNKLTYEGIMGMTYMEKVINETLRKHPPLAVTTRCCTKDYKVPNNNLVIEEGTPILIPVLGLHMDEEYFPNPEVFDPERFSEENKSTRPHFCYLPFGEGPRICIGQRFGMMQTKVGLSTLLKNYKFTLSPKTKLPLKLNPKSFILSTEGGMWLDCTKI